MAMQTPRVRRCLLLVVAALGMMPAVDATDLSWSADGATQGGSGDWDRVGLRWLDLTSQGGGVAWDHVDPGVATFAGTPGTVTLADIIAATRLSFTADGYVLAASADPAHTLSLSLGIDANGNTVIAAPLVLSAANSWNVAAEKALTVSGTVSGGFGLTKAGDGTLTLSGGNSFTGTTTLTAGTLVLGNTAALAASTLDLSGFGSVSFATPGTYLLGGLSGWQSLNIGGNSLAIGGTGSSSTYFGEISGTGGLTKAGAGTFTLSGGNSFTGTTTLTGGTLVLGHAAALAGSTLDLSDGSGTLGFLFPGNFLLGGLSGTRSLDIGGNSLDIGGGGASSTYAGVLSGTGGLTKTGLGTFTLSGANLHTGPTTLAAGTLVLGNPAALAGSTLDLAGPGTLGFATQGTYLLGGLSGVQPLDIGANSLTIGGSNASSSYFGVLSGTGGLTKAGTGTLGLSGVNTGYTGRIAVTGGVLEVTAESGLGATPATATADAVTLDGGALLLTTGNVTFSANRGFTLGAGGGTLDTSSITDATNNSVTFAGGISGTGGLTLRAHGDLSANGGGSNTRVLLSGANTFTGAVTITDGLVDAASSFGAATNALRFTNGGGLVQTAGTSTIARPIEVLAGGGTYRGWGSTTLTLSGPITGSGTLSRTDGGTLNLTGDLSGFTGTLSNSQGTTVLAPTLPGGFGGVVLGGGSLLISNHHAALGSTNVSVTGNATFGTQTGSSSVVVGNNFLVSGTNTLTLSGSNAPVVMRGGLAAGTGNLFLNAGNVTLAGPNAAGAVLTIGGAGGAILAPGFTGSFPSARLTSLNSNVVAQTMMVGGSLTVTSAAQDNRDAYFNFTQLGGTARLAQLNSNQTEPGQANAGGLSGINAYNLLGGTLEVGSQLAGSGGGSFNRSHYLVLGGGTLRGTLANAAWQGYLHALGGTTTQLDANGFTLVPIRNISGAGTLNLSAATGRLQLSNIASATPTFSGAGTLEKTGTATTALPGDFSAYTGSLILSAGTTQLGDAVDRGFAGAISGTGVFSKVGAGTLRLTGTNTWASNATVTAGALSIASTAALPGWNTSGRWSVSSGAVLAVGNAVADADFETIRGLSGNFTAGSFVGFDTQAGDRTYAGAPAGTIGFAKVGSNTLYLTNASAYTGPIGVFGGVIDLNGSNIAAAGAITLAGGRLVDGRITSATAVAAQSGALGASLSGTGGVTKTTSGVVSLSGVNTYTGATTISAGTLVVESPESLPRWNQAGGFSVANGAGLAVGNLFSNAQVTTLLGTGNFAAGSRIGFDTTLGDRTYAPVLANTAAGALGLVKTGPGTLFVTGASTFTGGVGVSGGTLAFSSLADATSSALGLGTALALDRGTLRFTGATGSSTARTLALTGSGNAIQVDAGATLTLGPNASGVTAAWTGSGGVTKTGAGTLTVGNNYSGATNRFAVGSDSGGNFTMAEGTLNISPTSFFVLGDNSQDATFLQTGGTVNFTAGSGSYIGNSNSGSGPYNASLIITGGTFNQASEIMRVGQNGYSRGFLTIGGGAAASVANINQVQLAASSTTSTGVLTLLANGTLATSSLTRGSGTGFAVFDGGTLRATANVSNLLSGVATSIRSGGAVLDDGGFTVTVPQSLLGADGSTGGLTKQGAGTLRITGMADYTGNTAVAAGTLSVASVESLPGWNTAGRWSTAAGTTLAVGASFTPAQVTSLVASGNFSSGAALGFDTADGARTFAGAIADGPGGPLAVTKIGANTLTLTGSSTYTGLTTVTAGTLELGVPTALADAAIVQVRSGGTLMFEVGGAGDFTDAALAGILPALGSAGATSGLRSGSFLGFNTAGGSFTLGTPITNSTGVNGGAVGLTKIGANALTLTGVNSYSGATTVSAGSLVLAPGASLTGGSAVTLPANTAMTLSSAASTLGAVTLSGGAFLDLGGGTSTVGAVTVNALPTSGAAIRNGTLNAASIVYNHTSGSEHVGATFNVSGRVAMNAAGSLEFGSGTHILSYFDVYSSGRVVLAGGATTTSARSFIGTGTLTISGGTHSMQGIRGGEGSGTITTINHTGGTLTITGNTIQVERDNSFLLNHWSGGSGGTYNLSAGTLNVRNTNVLLHWDGTGTFNQSGGVANLRGLDFNTSRGGQATYNLTGGQLNIGEGGIVANNTAETFTAGAATLGALADWSTGKTISLTDAVTGLTVATNDVFTGVPRTITLSGALSGTGRLNLNGSGALVLNAANTSTGLVTVGGGALRLANATSLAGGIGATGGSVALSLNGGVVDLAAGDFSRGLGSGAAQVAFAGSGGFAATGAARTVNLGGSSAPVTWGLGSFVPAGSEFLLGHSLANNTVTFTNPIDLGAADRTVRVARGSGAVDAVLSGSLTGTAGLVKQGTGILSLTGTNTYSGSTTIANGALSIGSTAALPGWNAAGRFSVASGATLAVVNAVADADVAAMLATGNFASGSALGFDTSAADRTYSAVFADVGGTSLGLGKTGTNTLTLTAANTHTGPTNVIGGTLRLSHQSALANSTLVPSGGSLVFDSSVTGRGFTAAGLTGSGNLALQNNAGVPLPITLTVGGNNASTTYSGALSGAGSLVKTGSGSLTLGGNSTMTGPVAVSSGTLLVAGTLPGGIAASSGTTVTIAGSQGLTGMLANATSAAASLATPAALEAVFLTNAPQAFASSSLAGANLDFGSGGTAWPSPYTSGSTNFIGRWTGQFFAATPGQYTFGTASDDGSMLWINGQTVVSNNFDQGVTERIGAITLGQGWHDVVMGYRQGTGGTGLYVNYQGPADAVSGRLPNSLLRGAPVVGALSGEAGSTVDLGSIGLVVNQTADSSFGGALVGSGTLTKGGVGLLTIADAAGFSGPVSVYGGQATLGGDFAASTARVLTVGSGTSGDSSIPRGLRLTGVVSGSQGLLVTGPGTLELTNPGNTFAGDIQNAAGVLVATSDGALGAAGNQIVLGNGATFRATGGFSTARTLDLAAGPSTTTLQATVGNTLTLTGTLLDASATTQLIKSDNGVVALGEITAPNWSGSLNQLNDPTALTGGIRVDAGVLRLLTSNALGSPSNIAVVNQGQNAGIELADGVNLPNTVVLSFHNSNSLQGLAHDRGNLFVASGSATLSGELNLRQDAAVAAAAGATLNLTGNLRPTGHILTILGAGTVNISGPSVNSGHSLYKLGAGRTNVTSAIPSLTGNGLLLVGGGGTLAFSGSGSMASGWTTGGVNVRGGDTLVLDNSGTALSNRLGGAAAFAGRDATLRLVGSASSTVTETLGTLTAAHGYTRLVLETTAQPLTLNFANLSSSSVNGGGTLLLETAGTGANLGSAAATVRLRDGLGVADPTWNIVPRAFVVDGLGTNFARYYDGSFRAFQGYATGDINALSAAGVSANAAWAPVASVDSSVTLGANRTLSGLRLAGGGLTLGANGGVLTLANRGGILAVGGTSTLATGSVVTGGANEVWIGVAEGSTFNLEGAVTTSDIITKALGGTLNISAPIYSTPSGWGYILNGGTTNLLADNVLYPGQGFVNNTQNLSIAYGATLDLRGTSQMVGIFHSPSNNAYANVAGVLTNSSETRALFVTNSNSGSGDLYPGVAITGNLSVVQAGNRTRYLTTAGTYAGRTALLNNLFVLSDEGRLSGTAGLDLNYGSRLYIRNTGTVNLTDRVSDSAAITLRGGAIEFNGRAQTDSTETLGAVNLAQGWNTFAMTAGGTGVNSSQITLSSISATGGVGHIGETNNTIDGQPGNSKRLLVAGDAVGAINGVVPYLVSNRELVGYVPGRGFGFLGNTGFPNYDATSLISGLNPTVNVKTSSTANQTLTANTSVNSLLWSYGNSSPTLTLGSNTLTLTAGVLALATGNDNTNLTFSGGFIRSGTADLYIHKLNYSGSNRLATISSVIQDGSAGATRLIVSSADGAGSSNSLDLSGANTYTGGTVVNGGHVRLTGGVNAVVLPAGGVTLNGGALSVMTNAGQINAANTVTLNGPATLTLAGTNTLQQLVFNNTGGTGTPTVSGGSLNLSAATAIVASGYNPNTIATVSSTLDFGGAAKTIQVAPLSYDGRAFAPYLASLNLSGVVQNAGQITVDGGGVLQLSGASTFTGGYSVAAGTGVAINANSTGTVTSGPLGTGALVLASGARLQSSGTFTVANAVTVNGELEFEGITGLGLSGAVTLGANATFDIQAPQPTLTLSGAVGGVGRSLTKTGYGTLALTAANTFDGGATVSRGTLSLGNAGALGSGTLTLAGGALDSSVANLALSTNNAQAWNGPFNFVGTQALNLGTGAVTLGGNVAVGVSANTLTVGGAIGDAGANFGLTKQGNGILRLTGANTYGGTTTVDAGVLAINSTAALPGWDTAGRVVVRNGGALAVGSGVVDADVTTMLGTGNIASGGAIGFDVATADRTWSSALTGAVGLALLDTDTVATNVLTVSGDNNFSGPTNVYSGSIRLAHQNALRGSVLNLRGGSLVFDSAVAGNAFSFGGLSGSANIALQNNATTPAAVALTVGSAGIDSVYTGVLSGSGSLIKQGSGKVTLTGANTFSGGLVVNAGTLLLANAGGTWNVSSFGAQATVNNGGRLQISMGNNQSASSTITVNGGGVLEYTVPFTLGGGNTTYIGTVNLAGSPGSAAVVEGYGAPRFGFQANGLINSTGAVTNTWAAGIQLVNGSSRTMTVTADTGNTLVISGAIHDHIGYENTPVTKSGAGTLVLSGANSFTGGTTHSAGILRLANTQALRNTTLTASATLQFDSSVSTRAFSLGGLSGATNIVLENNDATPAGVALTVGGNNSTTTYSGVLSGLGSLTKTGTGTLTLSGNNTYSGGTAVSAGTLTLSGNNAFGSGGITVTGGTLAVTGANSFAGGLSVTGGSASLAGTNALGSGGITVTGGTLSLAGTVTSSAALTVNGGVVTAAAGSALPGLSVAGRNAVAAGGTLALANGVSDADLASVAANTSWSAGSFLGLDTSLGNRAQVGGLAGGFTLSKIGANTLTLSGTNTHTGGLAVSAGTVVVGDLAALPGNAVAGRNTVASGGFLTFGNAVSEADYATSIVAATVASGGFVGYDTTAGNRTLSGPITGANGFAKTGTNTLTLGAGGTLTGPLNVAAGTLLLGGANTLGGGTYAGAITLGTGATLSVTTSANQTFSGGFSGAGTLAKSGAGTLTLSHASNSPAAISLTEGTLALGSVNTVQHALIDVGSAGPQNLSFAVAGTNTYIVGGLQGTDRVDLGVNSLQVGGNNLSSTYSGVVTGTGGLTKIGSGTFVLAGSESNTLTGTVSLQGGSSSYLGLAKTGGAVAVAGNISLAAGTARAVLYTLANNQFGPTSVLSLGNNNDNRFELRGTTQTLAGLDAATNTAAFIQHSEFTPGSNLSGFSNLIVNNAGNFNWTATIRDHNGAAGSFTLSKLGSGTQTLTGTNSNITYAGPTTVVAGTLDLNDTRGFASATYVGPSGTLLVRAASTAVFNSRTTQSNLTNLITGPGTLNITGATNGLAGSWVLLNSSTRGLYNFTGAVNVTSGVLSMDNIAGVFSGHPALSISSGAVVALRSQGVSVNALTGAGTVANTNNTGTETQARTLYVGALGGSATFTGVIAGNNTSTTDGNIECGLTNLAKLGAGTQILAPTATYTSTGRFSAMGGVLELDYASLAASTNLLAATAPVTVGSGTLRFRGRATGATTQTVAGVTLAANTGGSLLVNPNGGTGTTVTLGGFTPNSGSSLLVGTAPSAGAGTVTLSTSSTATAGILNRLVFTNGTAFDWAALSGTNLAAFSGYAALATAAGTNTDNSRITASTTLLGSVTTNTLKVEGPASGQSLDLGAGNTLTLTGGGLLATGGQAFAVSNGTLTAGNGIGAFELVVNQYSTGALTIGSVVADNGVNATGLTKAGTGELVLSGANTYTGTTSVVGGTLRVTGASSLGSGGVALGGGTLHLDSDTALAGSRAVTVAADSTLILGRATDGAGLNSALGSLTFNDGYTLTVTRDANVTSGTAVATFSGFPQLGTIERSGISSYRQPSFNIGADVEVNLTGAMSGTNVFSLLRKTGAGTLALSGGNTWWDPVNGYISLDAGTLDLRNVNALGDAGTGTNSIAVFMAGGSTLRYSADAATGNNPDVTLRGTGATLVANRATAGAGVTNQLDVLRSEGAFTLNVTAGSNVTSGTARFNFNSGQILGDTTLNVVNPSTAGETVLALGATNQLGGEFAVTKTGSGTLLLTGANSFTGLVLREGVTELSAAGAQGYAGLVTLAGGTLRFSSSNTADVSSRLAFGLGANAVIDTNGQTVSFASGIGSNSAGSLVKAGTGVLSLGAASTYTGNTAIQAGFLAIAGPSSLPGWSTNGRWSAAAGAGLAVGNAITDAQLTTILGTGNLAAGAFIGFDTSAGNRTYGGGITTSANGAVGLLKTGPNTLTLTGTNNPATGVFVSGGTLALSGAGSIGTTGLNLAASGAAFDISGFEATSATITSLTGVSGSTVALGAKTLLVGDASSTSFSGNISGTGATLTKQGAGTLTLAGTNTYTGGTSVTQGTLQANASAALASGTVDIGASGAVNLNASSQTWSHNFTGTGLLRLTFSSASTTNSYLTGNLSGFAGTIQLANSGTNGDKLNSNTGISAPNARLDIDSGSQFFVPTAGSVTVREVRVLGTGNSETRGALRVMGALSATDGIRLLGSTTIGTEGGTINANIASNVAGTQTLTFGTTASTGNLDVTGVIADGAGVVALTKTAAGTLTLNSANTYTGATTVSGGSLVLSGAGALPSATALNLSVSGAALNLSAISASSATIGSLTGASGSTFTLGPKTLVVGDATNTTFSGVVADGGAGVTGSLVKVGSGTLALAGTNTFKGGVTVSAGTLRLSAGAGAGTGTITLGDAATGSSAVTLITGLSPLTFANNIVVSALGSGTATIGSDGGTNGQPQRFTGSLTLNRATTLSSGTPDRTSYEGVISGNVGTLTIGGTGRTTLDNAGNNYVGDTVIASGAILQINAAGVLPDATNLTVNGNLYFNNGTETVASLAGAGNVQIHPSVSGTHTLVVNGTGSTTYSGTIQTGGSGTRQLNLTKQGSGTQVISGNISTAGPITVSGGLLSLTGASTFSGNVVVNGGTLRLAGTGSIWSATKAAADSLAISGGGVLEADRWAWGVGQSLGQLNYNNGYINVNGGTIRNVAAATTSFNNRGITVGANGIVYDNATAGTVFTIASGIYNNTYAANASVTLAGVGDGAFQQTISGTGVSLVKSGTGTWTLSGAATHTGATTVNAGTLVLSGSFGASSAIAVNSGGTLRFGANDRFGNHQTTTSPALTLAAGGRLQSGGFFNTLVNPVFNGGAIELTGGQNTTWGALAFKDTVTVGGSQATTIEVVSGTNNQIHLGPTNAAGNVTFAVADATGSSAADLTVAAVLRDNRNAGSTADLASGIIKQGAGTIVLSGTNTFTGGITVSAGTLEVGGSGTLGGGSYAATIANAGSLVFSTSANQTLSGAISGGGGLTKTGTGILTLAAANSFAGGLAVNGGRLDVADVAFLGTGPVSIGSAGALRLSLAPPGATVLSTLFGNGLSGTGVLDLNLTGQNPLSLGSYANFGGSVRVSAGVFDNTGFSGGVVFAGGRLLDPSSFTGTTTVSGPITDVSQLPTGGTVVLDAGGSIDFGQTPYTGTILFRGGSVSGSGFQGVLEVDAPSVAVSGSFGQGSLRLGAGRGVDLTGPTTGTILFDGGSITGGGNLSGRLQLGAGRSLVLGAGLDVLPSTVTLGVAAGTSVDLAGSATAATIDFTGGSIANAANFAGTIAVSQSAIFSTNGTVGGTVNLGTGTMLSGNGIFTGTVTAAAGATLSPGASPGLTSYQTLNLTGGSAVNLEFFSLSETVSIDGQTRRGYDSLLAETLNFGTAGNAGGGSILLRLATLTNWTDIVPDWNGTSGFLPAEGSSLIHGPLNDPKTFVIARFNGSDRLGSLSDGLDVTPWFSFDTDLYQGTGAGRFQVVANTGDTTAWELNMIVVPEPSTCGLMLGGAIVAAGLWRRRSAARG